MVEYLLISNQKILTKDTVKVGYQQKKASTKTS